MSPRFRASRLKFKTRGRRKPHERCGKIPNAPPRNVLCRRTNTADEFRRIRAVNLAGYRNFKYILTNKKVKYASNFNDQGFLC
ncbi:MAG: hypothetical protein HXK63_10090 [Campylobacter sp.]|nr:hypothetical protein [Campylobacter sp.]